MIHFYDLPVFGFFITILAFYIAQRLKKRFNYVFLNPVLVSMVAIITFLECVSVDFDTYNNGAKYLSFFLSPTIVALGVLFYEKFEQIKSNLKPFITAVAVGGTISIITVIVLSILLHAPEIITRSLAAKSVTTPIAIEITKITKGIPSITAVVVIAVGIFGNAFGVELLRFLKIKSSNAIGTALGTAAHGIGTARAIELDPLAGAYSGLAMCINGLITAVVTPYLVQLILQFA
ncbi:MAG: murein hydrolase effector protein LrgB [Flavobacteriaceae bacterium]|nr:MAG: murein hydrolase effector protein LrgB [Flavobacteriaceae bacterium]